MIKQFYEKALPSQGVYCVTGIDQSGRAVNKFAETLEDFYEKIDKFNAGKFNTYFALGTFEGYSRKKESAIFFRSFFIDLDVGETKDYADKGEANTALYKLIGATGLPDPVVVDSGGGIHAYWIMDRDIPADDWKIYSLKFKALCLAHINIDPVVSADASRVLRCPDSFNYKYNPPKQASLITEEIYTYDYDEFKNFLTEAEPPKIEATEIDTILDLVPKGLDEETRTLLHMDNFVHMYSALKEKSLNGVGCNQFKYMLENAATLEEPLWHSGLAVVKFCADGALGIHDFSKDHPGYKYEDTEEKASRFPAPRTCDWFISNYPSGCDGCQFKGRIKTPIVLGKELQIQKPTEPTEEYSPSIDKEESVWEVQSTEKIPDLPNLLSPFVRGEEGGIYYVPPPKVVNKKTIQPETVLILIHEFYPVRRMYSSIDGECMTMRLHLPNDSIREFLLPMKVVYALERLKEYLSSNGIFYEPDNINIVQKYLVKWAQWMVFKYKADIMRMQMGWTEEFTSPNWKYRSFVIGNKEINHEGKESRSAASPLVRGVAKFLAPVGSYDEWQKAAYELNRPELEIHAFTMLSGFGSVLMPYLSTSGMTISLLGRSGAAKTGALYAGLSIFGNPKELSIFDATDNGMTGRYLGLKNLLLGIDEVGNKDAKALSQLTHKISHGKAKIRMQASVNAEREHEMAAALIGVYTTNESVYNKFEILKGSPDGEAARIIEFLVKKPSCLQGAGGGELARSIFDTFRTNFGHAGPEYIKEVFRVGDDYIKQRMAYWRSRFIADFGDDNTYRFHENLIMANFTAGDIANGAGIINLELEHIFESIVRQMIHIRDTVLKVNFTDYESILGDYVYKKLDKILIVNENKVTLEPKNSLVARIEVENSLLIISKSDFKEYLNLLKITPREFEDNMRANNILIDDKKARLTTGWKSAVSPVNINAYWFKTAIPEEWLHGDPDAVS